MSQQHAIDDGILGQDHVGVRRANRIGHTRRETIGDVVGNLPNGRFQRPVGVFERGPIDEYAGGEIRAYHGIVNRWLLVVYAILAVWGIYYLLRYWGGLGPGLAR